MTSPRPRRGGRHGAAAAHADLDLRLAATLSVHDALSRLATTEQGLDSAGAAHRLHTRGPNLVHTYRVRAPRVLARQFNSPLLLLLALASVGSYAVGERVNAALILAMIAISVALGFINEYRAERTAVDLHRSIRSFCTVLRDSRDVRLEVADLVPGDIVTIEPGAIVPADIRLVSVAGLECNESILTGESTPSAKQVGPIPTPADISEFGNCAFMGSVVAAGIGTGVVVTTGARTHFGALALDLGLHEAPTGFQVGLRRFSRLLFVSATALSAFVFIANVVVSRPTIDALLFALAIAVGIAPEMLSAVVTISLSRGSRLLARKKVILKRLISIEDLGNIDVLFTDKTGTLTEGRLVFESAIDAMGRPDRRTFERGLMATASAQSHDGLQPGHSALDQALWTALEPATAPTTGLPPVATSLFPPESVSTLDQRTLRGTRLIATLPFDHERQRSSTVLVGDATAGALLLVKGAPESVLRQCRTRPEGLEATLEAHFHRGARVIALAEREWHADEVLTTDSETDLNFIGLLVYRDVPKPGVRDAVHRLHDLDIDVKVLTGDNAEVARHLCSEVGIETDTVLTAAELDAMDDAELAAKLPRTRVFARVSPEQKQRIVRVQRRLGSDVACLGDGVNDSLALHEADVGISVENATDIAKDAADVLLLEKDLHVLADGVVQGRRVFANTVKYVAMGSSSNFGNMLSAAAASAFLPFLPMLPAQVLLNNLLYDLSQFPISTDRVDPEQLRRPAHWDIGLIRRYMIFFGLVSSVFDITTFIVMLRVFHTPMAEFRSAWFLESLATQTLVVFLIRTRRRPAWLSPPSIALAVGLLGTVAVGTALLWSPWAPDVGFARPSAGVAWTVLGLVIAYLLIVELAKDFLNASVRAGPTPPRPVGGELLDGSGKRQRRRRLHSFTHGHP